MKVVKVLQKGQIVIPKEIREKVGIKIGNKVLVQETEGAVLIMPEPKDPLEAMVGLWKEYRPKEPSWKVLRKMRNEDERKDRLELRRKKR